MTERFVVLPEEAGMRLDKFLTARIPSWSRAQLQEILDQGGVAVGGKVARKSAKVHEGAEVVVECAEHAVERESPLQAEQMDLDVLYEDDQILAVNKPAGLVVHPGHANHTGTLVHGLLYHSSDLSEGSAPDRPGIVHRLDKDTTGVLLVARTDSAHAALSKQFAERLVRKTYFGFCIGNLPPAQGTIDRPLARSHRDPTRVCVHRSGRQSLTLYRRIVWRCGVGLMAFAPRTGRTHQIRVHASSVAIPIVADNLYGGGREAVTRLEPLDRPFAYQVHKCFDRHALHARTVRFAHPADGREMRISAPFPADFLKAMALFGTDAAPEVIDRVAFEESS